MHRKSPNLSCLLLCLDTHCNVVIATAKFDLNTPLHKNPQSFELHDNNETGLIT